MILYTAPKYVTNECMTTVKGTVHHIFKQRFLKAGIKLPVGMNTTLITWDFQDNKVESLIQDNNKDSIEKTYVQAHLN